MKEPFLSAVPVLEKLESSGFEAYFVGGSVRDYLLDKPIHDIDIATSATPDEVKQIFTKTVDIGIEHGTVLVIYRNDSYEITTFRTEAEYQDYRRPKEVAFIRNLHCDLQRRDFTMNAIAMDRKGNLIDPFQGQKSIADKMIRTVGRADERFQEDALRMMRAVRFVSQLSFQVETETLNSLSNKVSLLENIAVERKQAEFEKLLSGVNRKQALSLLINTGIYNYLPGLKDKKKNLENFLAYDILRLTSREMWALLVYSLDHEGKNIELFLRDWRMPLREIRIIQQILYYLDKRMKHEWTTYELYSATKEIARSAEMIYLVLKGIKELDSINLLQQTYDDLPIKDRTEMSVTGQDLMQWYSQSGGPWLKDIILKIENAILTGEINNSKQGIKEWLMECNHK